MPNYRRVRVPGGTFFFTVNLQQRDRTLLVDHIAHLRAAFRIARACRPFGIIALVVLPEHLHCIWRLPPGDSDNAARWSHIKSELSRRLPRDEGEGCPASRVTRRERGLWQRRYWERVLRDECDLAAHVDYIHFNPVKHGLVARAADWPHSTFHRYVADGLLGSDWGVAAPGASSMSAAQGEAGGEAPGHTGASTSLRARNRRWAR